MSPRRRRILGRLALGVIAALVLATVIAQLLLPGYAADRIESRLTGHGGQAHASVHAFPALRLLFGHGDRIEIDASGVDLGLQAARDRPFSRLDGFEHVAISVRGSRAGPLSVSRMELARDGSSPYRFVWRGSVSLADLAGSAGSQFGLFGALAGQIAAGSIPNGSRPLPIDLDMTLASEGGRLRVLSGGGTIAGLPTGPLAELLTNAIAVRL
ncbi:MAG: hypothetical protein QOJ38_1493 [Solirubrobacterales bacterium]|jgi:hypothetical protein|nr:hypothetical protein [Solirubrobacterales bacterium]